jgi:hypothetical protein
MKRPSYVRPQTLDDWRKYRLSDLFEFTAMPEHERAVMRWSLDNEGVHYFEASDNYKIGGEWFLQFVKFRQTYAHMKQRGTFLKTIAELEAAQAERVKR